MQRKFLTNLLLLLFLNLLVKPFWIFGIDMQVQNTVGPDEYGFYFSVLNLTFLFNIVLDVGITGFNNRNIAQNHQLLNKHFSGILLLKASLAGLYFMLTICAGLIIGFEPRQMFMLGFLVFNQFLLSFVLYLRSNISGLHLFKTDSVLSVLDRVLMIVFCGILLLWGTDIFEKDFQIEWFVYCQSFAYLLTAFIAFITVARKASFKKPKWNKPFNLMILRQSFPFAILALLMAFYNRADAVMLERLLPGETGNIQAGLYASAFRLLDSAHMIAYLFSVLLLPIFSRMVKIKESPEKLVKLAITILFVLSSTVAVVAYTYDYNIVDILYRLTEEQTQESSQVLSVLMFGFIGISTTYVFGSLLTANGNLKYLNIVAFSGMAINILMNLVLIPKYYALGAAYASMTTQLITALIQMIIACRIFKFRLNWIFIFRLMFFAGLLLVISWFTSTYIPVWIYGFIIICGFSLAAAFFLGLLNIKSLVQIVRSGNDDLG